MSKRQKLIERFLSMPSDFHYKEMVRLLRYYGFEEVNNGKASGSRVQFLKENGIQIKMHKPHPSGILKRYQMKQVKEILGL